MEKKYTKLLDNNKSWVSLKKKEDPEFFKKLSQGQSPEYLWIGCSDSRVPANEITGTNPGEIFVHRNVANLVVHSDMNLLSVLSYAVEVLKVKHIIVCGHYGCGGVLAAMGNDQLGLIDNWLRKIKDVYKKHKEELDSINDYDQRAKKLVEYNIVQQVRDLGKTSIVQNAWNTGQNLHVHGWVYDLHDGLIQDLHVSLTTAKDLNPIYRLNNKS